MIKGTRYATLANIYSSWIKFRKRFKLTARQAPFYKFVDTFKEEGWRIL